MSGRFNKRGWMPLLLPRCGSLLLSFFVSSCCFSTSVYWPIRKSSLCQVGVQHPIAGMLFFAVGIISTTELLRRATHARRLLLENLQGRLSSPGVSCAILKPRPTKRQTGRPTVKWTCTCICTYVLMNLIVHYIYQLEVDDSI